MDTSSKQDNKLPESIYSNKKISIVIISLIGTGIFFGFLFNLAIKEKLFGYLENVLQTNKICPISYEKIDYSLLTQSIKLKEVTFSERCLKTPSPITVSSAHFSLSRPTIYPFGARFKISLNKGKNKFTIYPTISLGKVFVKISESQIDSSFLKQHFNLPVDIQGLFQIDGVLKFFKKDLKDSSFHVKSKNLFIPKQNIGLYEAPKLRINHLSLKANIDKKKISFEPLIIGDNDSPVVSRLQGSIKLNTYRMTHSKMNLTGELKVSKELLDEQVYLKLILPEDKKNDTGFYNIELKGTFNKPKFKAL